jgi:hypothetical protein
METWPPALTNTLPMHCRMPVSLPGDVLLSFDGTPIANDGTVPFRSGERISFSYLTSTKFHNEMVGESGGEGGGVGGWGEARGGGCSAAGERMSA